MAKAFSAVPETKAMDDTYYSVEQVADKLGVRPSTVRAWKREGRISCVKFGSLVRFTDNDINTFVASGRA